MNKVNDLPQVAIIGRTNVGKSTLFNRLVEGKKALVSDFAGTTRDRNYQKCIWRGKEFMLIDTGGLDVSEIKDIDRETIAQSKKAINEADLLLFLVDLKTGILPADRKIAKLLRGADKPFILVANKAEKETDRLEVGQLMKIGLGEPMLVSALSGRGTGDLLDASLKKIRKRKAKSKKETINVTFVGKPNVGKSSLVNAVLGEKRVVVTPVPHTTREPQDIEFSYKKKNFTLIDTAGLRQKRKFGPGLEKSGIMMTLKTLPRADVALFVLEINETLTAQDSHIAESLLKHDTGLIIVANKWDLVKSKEAKTINEYAKYIQDHFPYLSWAPIIFTSATEKQRTKKILDLVLEVKAEQKKEIDPSTLQKFIEQAVKKHRPTKGKGTKYPKVYGLKQTGIEPPTFSLAVNLKSDLHFSYLRYIENRLRERFGFMGTPIKINVKRVSV